MLKRTEAFSKATVLWELGTPVRESYHSKNIPRLRSGGKKRRSTK